MGSSTITCVSYLRWIRSSSVKSCSSVISSSTVCIVSSEPVMNEGDPVPKTAGAPDPPADPFPPPPPANSWLFVGSLDPPDPLFPWPGVPFPPLTGGPLVAASPAASSRSPGISSSISYSSASSTSCG